MNSEPFRERYGLIRFSGQSDGGMSRRGASPQLPSNRPRSALSTWPLKSESLAAARPWAGSLMRIQGEEQKTEETPHKAPPELMSCLILRNSTVPSD